MLCSGRVLAVSPHINPLFPYRFPHRSARFRHVKHELHSRWRSMVADPGSSSSSSSSSSFATSIDSDPTKKKTAGFCIIEGPKTEQDFVSMELQEIQDCIRSRRNKIFLHMEESSANLKLYYVTCFSLIAGIILLGGILAPSEGEYYSDWLKDRMEDTNLKRAPEDLQNRIDILRKRAEGPVIDVVVWHDGQVWMVALDTHSLEDDLNSGQLYNFIPLTNHRWIVKFSGSAEARGIHCIVKKHYTQSRVKSVSTLPSGVSPLPNSVILLKVPVFSGFPASPNGDFQMFPVMYPALVPGLNTLQN